MRILVIGDIHGHNDWEKIVLKEDWDKVIFLGDYFDTYDDISGKAQCINFKVILQLKKSHSDKVELLYGNHDHSYLNKEKCSGYSSENQVIYEELLKEAMDKRYLNPIYVYDDIIFSHAGVSSYWLKEVAKLNKPEDISFDTVPLDLFDFNTITGHNPYGNTISQSPIWIRPYSLYQNPIEGYRQIVGHTHIREAFNIEWLYLNDLMPNYYIIVEDGNIKYKKNEIENSKSI